MSLAVVVPTHDRRDLLIGLLRSLAAQTAPRDAFEVVVVCDGCTDGTAEAARDAARRGDAPPGLTVIEQERSGAAVARNRGVRASAAGLILFLDDDMTVPRDLVAVHLERHDATPGCVVLGRMSLDPSSPRSYLTEGLARWTERRHRRLTSGDAVPADEILTGHLSLPRMLFEQLGGFDVRFTAGGSFGGEDVELGWRIRRRGVPVVYEPRAVSAQVWTKSFLRLCSDIRPGAAADVRRARIHPEILPHIPLGRRGGLPRAQRWTLEATLARPRLLRLPLGSLEWALDLAARRGATGSLFERLHAVCRAHRYALGMLDAGWTAQSLS